MISNRCLVVLLAGLALILPACSAGDENQVSVGLGLTGEYINIKFEPETVLKYNDEQIEAMTHISTKIADKAMFYLRRITSNEFTNTMFTIAVEEMQLTANITHLSEEICGLIRGAKMTKGMVDRIQAGIYFITSTPVYTAKKDDSQYKKSKLSVDDFEDRTHSLLEALMKMERDRKPKWEGIIVNGFSLRSIMVDYVCLFKYKGLEGALVNLIPALRDLSKNLTGCHKQTVS